MSIDALADSTVSGTPNNFVVASNYFTFGNFHDANGLQPVNQMSSGSFDVIFDPGDSDFQITFTASQVVNAGVSAAPEPGTTGLLMLALVPVAMKRRRRKS